MLKFHKIDWHRFCRALAKWEQIRKPARELFLSLAGNPRSVDAPSSLFHLDELIDADLVLIRGEQGVITVPEEVVPFWRTMRALMMLSQQTGPGFADFDGLVRTLLSRSDRLALLPSVPARGINDALREICGSSDWLRAFLDLQDPSQFESDHAHFDEAHCFITPSSLPNTQELVKRLIESGSPLKISELAAHNSSGPLALMLRAGFRYLLFYPGIVAESLDPFVFIWPPALKRLRRPRPEAPKKVTMVREFSGPFLVDDMTRILTAAGRGLRVRVGDGVLFAKDEKRIARDLAPIPDWLQEHVRNEMSSRISFAMDVIEQARLMRFEEGIQGQMLRVMTSEGKKWLGQPSGLRVKAIADCLREDWRGLSGEVSYVPWKFEVHGFGRAPSLTERIQKAFLSQEIGESVSFQEFGKVQRTEDNPLLELKRKGELSYVQLGWRYFRNPASERLELLWHNLLLEFLCGRLFPIGGARLGVSEKGDFCFGLTEIGRYFLGATTEFDPGFSDDQQILVQPNFEITFITQNPLIEADIARFAERIGRSPGVVFRITRDSITAAAGSGLGSDQILRSLTEASTQALPNNVTREVEGWVARCRTVDVRETVIIECPDPETARRVLAVGRKKVRLLNDATVEVLDPTNLRVLSTRLRKAGIFSD